MPQLKRYTGSIWQNVEVVKEWNGTKFTQLQNNKYWNGSSWVRCTKDKYAYNDGNEYAYLSGGYAETSGTASGGATKTFTKSTSSLILDVSGGQNTGDSASLYVRALTTIDLTNVSTVRFNISSVWTASSSYRSYFTLRAGSAQYFTGYMTASGNMATQNIDLNVSAITGSQIISMEVGKDKWAMNLVVNSITLIP